MLSDVLKNERKREKEWLKQGAQQERIETAKRFLQEGLSVELVARASLLPVEEVQRLKNDASLVSEPVVSYNQAT